MSILIISKNRDIAVDLVINWLEYYFKTDVFVIHSNSDIGFSTIDVFNIGNSILTNKYGKRIEIRTIQHVWLHGFYKVKKNIPLVDDPELNYQLNENLSEDSNSILFFIIKFLKDVKVNFLGIEQLDYYDKIYNLYIAKKIGLTIPETYVVSSKSELKKLTNNVKKYVTKSYDLGININTKKYILTNPYTEDISLDNYDVMDDFFHPSYLQEKINKKYELRIFFINDIFFSLAIFSQTHSGTMTDFRKENSSTPIRMIPYVLPTKIKNKLIQFLACINLRNGSIDMIVTKNNKFIFLEVNACGQSFFVSYNGNYNIEKKIASILSNG